MSAQGVDGPGWILGGGLIALTVLVGGAARAGRTQEAALDVLREVHHRKVPKFLRDARSAFRWARRNVDLNYPDSEDRDQVRWADSDYRDLANDYAWFAREVYRKGEVTIYRKVRLLPGEEVNLHHLGKAWSRVPEGAGVYGMAPREGRDVLITGIVRAKDIDWSYGFTSFMAYGRDQWEVSLLPHVPVTVVAIGGQVLSSPAQGSSGVAEETWRIG